MRDLVEPQDCKLQKGLVSPEGGKSSTPWTFQDGPDHHHLGLTWSYFKATNLELQLQVQKTYIFKASKRIVN